MGRVTINSRLIGAPPSELRVIAEVCREAIFGPGLLENGKPSHSHIFDVERMEHALVEHFKSKPPAPLEASDREWADLSLITPFNEEQHKEVEQIALAAYQKGFAEGVKSALLVGTKGESNV